MSRFENVAQTSSRDRRISHRLQYIPCGRCCAVIEYGRGTEWHVVSELVNEHWKACPRKPCACPGRMTRTPTSPFDTTIVLPPPGALDPGNSPSIVAESVSSQHNTWISPGCERKRRTLEQRKWELEQDEYAKNVTTKSVVCGGCHKEISLDKRSKYYPGLWLKHRGKCPGIEKLESAKARTPHVVNGTRPVSCDVVIPAFGGHGYGHVLQLDPAERYEGHTAGHTSHQLVRHYDSDDRSSEDGEEDEDVLSHEPFPTLNSAFYRTQRLYDRSDAWAYRYATEEEITTNFFHGQDDLCARVGTSTRVFDHVALQARGHDCDGSCCVIQHGVDQAASCSDEPSAKEVKKPERDTKLLSWQRDYRRGACEPGDSAEEREMA